MKTYILKRPVYNSEDFPIGTIVKEVKERFYCFEVVSGKLKGKKGQIADGLNGVVCDNTIKNRKIIKQVLDNDKKLRKAIIANNLVIDKIPSSTIK